MLNGVILVGALRQRVEKAIGWHGPAPTGKARGPVGMTTTAGLSVLRPPMTWLGSPAARQDWVRAMAATLTAAPGRPLPPGVNGIASAVDRHVLEVGSAAEQTVLCNLIRRHSPVLIALTGRSGTGTRRLGAARDQVAARHLDAADPEFRTLLEAHLRRVEGFEAIDRTDVHPSTEPDGTPTVTVQCVDAAATLAAVRAHALLLAAFALRARRLVQEGVAVETVPQRVVDENRARAVASGLRARPTDDVGSTLRHRTRGLLADVLAIELDNLDTQPEELFPILAPIERLADDDSVLTGNPDTISRALTDTTAGGPCLAAARRAAEGRTWLLVERWAGVIAARGGGVEPSRGTAGARR
ncbi:hypothetical protein Q0Z83_015860 [Actinoplanes sichuanensis]|uniref:Uncharacterized protein n=1 Tax=Actinoplanes sichuanensis TaxID=512349 RepID=A0ABW4A790_9ACTN|nr:hypothetical protein [Actinoplanes sichuanensis]BEL03395.1 hypothetical protein Q0Z83_015860 [Actinoplanes sichuanensis]